MTFGDIEDPAILRRVLEASLLIEASLDLPSVLRHVIEEARSMTGARYGAIGVLNDEGTALAEFLTSGLEPHEEARIGARPTGLGVLGLLISNPQTLRLAHLDTHPERFGFPPNHPPMTSFLGVSIKVRDAVYGNLYLTDKAGGSEFSRDDQVLVEALAVAAGIAVENARLHQVAQEALILKDRDRVAKELHDTVIQHLFAIGLTLQSMAGTTVDAGLGVRLTSAVKDIDHTIQQVRTTIYDLGSSGVTTGVRAEVLAAVRELEPVVGFHVEVSFSGPVDTAIPPDIKAHVLATAREALTYIANHADATSASVTLSLEDGMCSLRIVDDGARHGEAEGHGYGSSQPAMHRRAENLQGRVTLERLKSGGTSMTWQVPLGP